MVIFFREWAEQMLKKVVVVGMNVRKEYSGKKHMMICANRVLVMKGGHFWLFFKKFDKKFKIQKI